MPIIDKVTIIEQRARLCSTRIHYTLLALQLCRSFFFTFIQTMKKNNKFWELDREQVKPRGYFARSWFPCLARAACSAAKSIAGQQYILGSLRNHNDDGNKNVTNLHIWQWKTIDLHALHVHFSFLDIPLTFSFFLRREMTCFAVVRTTWAQDDKCSILSSYLWSTGSNLISG